MGGIQTFHFASNWISLMHIFTVLVEDAFFSKSERTYNPFFANNDKKLPLVKYLIFG